MDKEIESVLPREKISQFCKKWKIKELDLFGSIVRGGFNSNSDIDFLVTFSSDTQWSLFDWVHMEDELESITGRSVDLVSRDAVEKSRNTYRKKSILESLQPYYVQG